MKDMLIYEIIDEENLMISGVLLYYEKEKAFIIELQEYLDEWTSPLLFTSYVKKGIYTIPRDISLMWVKARIIPSGRQNISSILQTHKLESYDEMKFLSISEGRCSQDNLYLKKRQELPLFVMERQRRNLVDVVVLKNHKLLCFFKDGKTKKVDLESLSGINGLDKIVKFPKLYESGKIGVGGYAVTFNDTYEIPAFMLYPAGEEISLSLDDFFCFANKNLIDTSKSGEILACSRQNINYMVTRGQIHPVKENVRGNLFLKGDILKSKW